MVETAFVVLCCLTKHFLAGVARQSAGHQRRRVGLGLKLQEDKRDHHVRPTLRLSHTEVVAVSRVRSNQPNSLVGIG